MPAQTVVREGIDNVNVNTVQQNAGVKPLVIEDSESSSKRTRTSSQ